MINEKILQEEFWKLFDILQHRLNWNLSLDTFDITDNILANDFQYNKSLVPLIEQLINSDYGLSFTMIGYRAQENPNRPLEELMFYAMKLGYAMHQLDIKNVTSYDGAIEYDSMFEKCQVQNHFELIADFFTDEYMSEKLCISQLHHESFIYFSLIMGFIIRAQLIKLKLNVLNDMQPQVKKKPCPFKQGIQLFPNIIIIQSDTEE